jgi:hypothetical protein
MCARPVWLTHHDELASWDGNCLRDVPRLERGRGGQRRRGKQPLQRHRAGREPEGVRRAHTAPPPRRAQIQEQHRTMCGGMQGAM